MLLEGCPAAAGQPSFETGPSLRAALGDMGASAQKRLGATVATYGTPKTVLLQRGKDPHPLSRYYMYINISHHGSMPGRSCRERKYRLAGYPEEK